MGSYYSFTYPSVEDRLRALEERIEELESRQDPADFVGAPCYECQKVTNGRCLLHSSSTIRHRDVIWNTAIGPDPQAGGWSRE